MTRRNTPIGIYRSARSWRAATAWLLIAGFLLQPVLAYLVTPVLTHDVKGQQVVVCTLKGERVVTLDIPQLAGEQETEHCAALKLYQMASSTQVSEPPMAPAGPLPVPAAIFPLPPGPACRPGRCNDGGLKFGNPSPLLIIIHITSEESESITAMV